MSRSWVLGPAPQSRLIGSGARNSASPPRGTIVSPSGLSRSEATFAQYLLLATPIEIVSCVRSRTSWRILFAIATPSPKSSALPVTSRKASSSDSGSTSGVTLSKTARTSRATST